MNKRLESLEPDFREQIEALLPLVEAATKRKWGVVCGRRTMAEQREIYAQGRTKPGKVVSNAKPGQSAHNFGYAVDLCPLTSDGKDFNWETPDTVFKQMADIAVQQGLTAGYYFKTIHDAPHIESAKWKERQALWKDGQLSVA